MAALKLCTKCGDAKPLSLFYRNDRYIGGYAHHCKACNYERAKKRYRENPEKIKAYVKQWVATNRDKANSYSRAWRLRNPEHAQRVRHKSKLKTYGLSEEDYQQLLESQARACKICGASQSSLDYKLCVDHDHRTGVVRGLLCKDCNSAIGLFKDTISNLENAARYLRTYANT